LKNPEIQQSSGALDERSIFGEILDWMLAPLLFFWPISIALTYHFSESLANLPYDQMLREQLVAMARGVAPGKLPVPSSGSGIVALRLVDAQGRTLAGAEGLPASPQANWPADIGFRDEEYRGQTLRLAEIRIPGQEGQLLVAGETREKRARLAYNIIVYVIVPQFFLIPLAVVLLWFGLKRGLGPLARLRDVLGARDSADLSPIATRSVPEELEPLVDSFNAMLRRMQRNVDSQHRFIADAAHQIRTPLAGLKTQAQLAMRETDPEALRHALGLIANSVDRATRLAHQLLTLARTESGEIGQQKFAVIDLDQLLREGIEGWVMRALERQIDLGYDPRGEALVRGSDFLLRELINNLVDNALRYTPPGGTVTGRATHNGEFIVLEIEDSGIGISLEQAELVFERFYRVDNANTEGSGLGLAIVREIATLHEAYAALRPNPKGQGAVARVVFRAWSGADEAESTE